MIPSPLDETNGMSCTSLSPSYLHRPQLVQNAIARLIAEPKDLSIEHFTGCLSK